MYTLSFSIRFLENLCICPKTIKPRLHCQSNQCMCPQGEEPSVQSALDIYHVLTESNTDLRQPVGLESQLLKKSSMDTEVGMSMLQLLTVCCCCTPLQSSIGQLMSCCKLLGCKCFVFSETSLCCQHPLQIPCGQCTGSSAAPTGRRWQVMSCNCYPSQAAIAVFAPSSVMCVLISATREAEP